MQKAYSTLRRSLRSKYAISVVLRLYPITIGSSLISQCCWQVARLSQEAVSRTSPPDTTAHLSYSTVTHTTVWRLTSLPQAAFWLNYSREATIKRFSLRSPSNRCLSKQYQSRLRPQRSKWSANSSQLLSSPNSRSLR